VFRAPQLRGLLLEEAILALLNASGYKTVEYDPGDPTLSTCSAGLEVSGRGCRHQIDAVADFLAAHPFSHAQRLLVEGKFLDRGRKVGLSVIRNAVGVLTDVGQFWQSRSGEIPQARYHYQYAVFSAAGFSEPSQRYAFAHDIYLFPLGDIAGLQPLLDSIRVVEPQDFASPTPGVRLGEIRSTIRQRFAPGTPQRRDAEVTLSNRALAFVSAVGDVRGAFVGVIARQFPILLLPTPTGTAWLAAPKVARIRPSDKAWEVQTPDGERLFSFDLPLELFRLYMASGRITPSAAVHLKSHYLNDLQVFQRAGERVRIVSLALDDSWLDSLQARFGMSVTDSTDPSPGRLG